MVDQGSFSMRIWHQSLTDFAAVPDYPLLLEKLAARACRPDTRVDLHGVPEGTYPAGVAPIKVLRYRWIERILAEHVIRAVMRAEEEDYDAVAISCFFDPVLTEARSIVDIPVVSAFESSCLAGFVVGQSLGIVVLDDRQAISIRAMLRTYGYAGRVGAVVALDPPLDEHQLVRGVAPETLLENLELASRRAVHEGADVIIPAEGVFNAVVASQNVRELGGAPVVDGLAVTLAHAEMLVQLRRSTGLQTSRVGALERPPGSLVSHFRP